MYKRKYVYEVLVNCLFKLAQEKVLLTAINITVGFERKATNLTKGIAYSVLIWLFKELKGINPILNNIFLSHRSLSTFF